MISKIINFLRARFRKYLNEETWLEDYVKAGLKIGKNCDINPGVIFDISHCWLIEIGNNVTVAPYAYFLAHDASTFLTLGYTKIGKVVIGDGTFIGARAIIMPGVTIGENCVVAAGSVVTKSIEKNTVVGGNPAIVIMTRDALIAKHEEKMKHSRLYGESYRHNNITTTMKQQMSDELQNESGYVI